MAKSDTKENLDLEDLMEEALRTAGPETVQQMLIDSPAAFMNLYGRLKKTDVEQDEERVLRADMTKHDKMLKEISQEYGDFAEECRASMERCPHCGEILRP
jgi:type VI protein secretion system component VasK